MKQLFWIIAPFCLISCARVQPPSSSCPAAPAPQKDIVANSYYSDKANSIVDPLRKKTNEESVALFENYLKNLQKLKQDHCRIEWLETWAKEDAMLGNLSSSQAHYEQNWMLAGLSLTYLKMSPSENILINHWFAKLAEQVKIFSQKHKIEKRNNHYYWEALAIAASAKVRNDPQDFSWAMQAFHFALSQINENGILPLEMARQGRALSYHHFALSALIPLYDLAIKTNEPINEDEIRRLKKLVEISFQGLKDPSFFEKESGKTQEIPRGSSLAYLEIVQKHFPQKEIENFLILLRPLSSHRLGGIIE